MEQMQASFATPPATDACQTLPYDPDAAAAQIDSQWRLEDYPDTQLDEDDTAEDPEISALLRLKTLTLGETPLENDKDLEKDPEGTKHAEETPRCKEEKPEVEVNKTDMKSQEGPMEVTDEKKQGGKKDEGDSKLVVEVEDGEVKGKDYDDGEVE